MKSHVLKNFEEFNKLNEAFIDNDKISEMRKKIREEFPTKNGWKISVVRRHYSVVDVHILEAPVQLTNKEDGYEQLNPYQLEKRPFGEFLTKIKDICMEGNHDNSDAMTDYFDVGWYFHITIGAWDKPFKLSEKK
jgi:hypothetical protein